ncbi:transglycosylase domain-containing protein [Microbacterium sp. NPDC003461]
MPNAKRTPSGVLSGVLGLVGLSAVAGLLVTAAVTPAIAMSGAAASSAISLFENLPGILKVDRPMEPSTIYAKDEAGNDVQLATFYDQNRQPVEYDQVSRHIYDAILSSEDPRYYEHGGVDLIGTTRALLNNASGGTTQGGSSISQQYVKNVLIQQCEQEAADDEELRECFMKHTNSEGVEGYERKLQEMRYAIAIEKEYSKDDILLGYLNIANFGGQTYGIEAAARYYFNTSAKDVTVGQAAVLAGIVQNPNIYRIDMRDGSTVDEDGNPINSEADGYSLTKGRQLYVLKRLLEDGKITQEQHDQAAAEPIVPAITPTDQGCRTAGGSAYFCQYVRSIILTDEAFGASPTERAQKLQRGGLDIYTTLDLGVQRAGEDAMRDWAPSHIDGMNFGATGVSMEAQTGRILAMVQNTEFTENSQEPGKTSIIYAADAAHGASTGFEVGSSYKLFTLIDWLEKGKSVNQRLNGTKHTFSRMKACGQISPSAKDTGQIGNYGGSGGYYGTPMTFTRDSLNTGYLAMAEQLDICDINKVAERMGVTLANGESVTKTNVPYDVLGSKNIAPMDMAAAYAAVANGGVLCEPIAIDRVVDSGGVEQPVPEPNCEKVIEPNVAATAAHVLQGVMQPGGTGYTSNTRDGVPLIGKTGTHEDDQTFMVESSTKVATAVWVGNVDSVQENGQWVRKSMSRQWANGIRLSDIRHRIAPALQSAANAKYGGDPFPEADRNLLVTPMADLPDVTGKTVEEATRILSAAGFDANVGEPVTGDQPDGTVQTQEPGAGRVAVGTVVTISPSNGQGVRVPNVAGAAMAAALGALQSAGLDPARGSCSEAKGAGSGKATGTAPAADELVAPGTRVTVDYQADDCGGGNNGGGNNGGGNDDD